MVSMDIARITRHLFTTHRQVTRAFPQASLDAIEAATRAAESAHGGEIRFAVEGALDGNPLFRGQAARERAIEVFSMLRVWDTEHNNGLLIYLLLADRAVEIVADRGIHAKVGASEWSLVCREMEAALGRSDFEGGVVSGLQSVARHLALHFPAGSELANELPDRPTVL
jgi:uncharacterized membrane protein